MATNKADKIKHFVKMKGVCMLDEVMEKFSLSKPSTTNYFKRIGILSSFNCDKNRRNYYIVPESFKFDKNGFLFRGKIGFYKGGTLLKAICELVECSAEGLGARELDELLKTTTHTQLPKLFAKGKLSRLPAPCRQGNAYIYFSSDPEKAKEQQALFFKEPVVDEKVDKAEVWPYEHDDVIDVFLTLIANPEFNAKSIHLSLKRRGKLASRDLVDRVFSKYLNGKKNS